jgi:hypothetical protein
MPSPMRTGKPTLWLKVPTTFCVIFKDGGMTDKHAFLHLMCWMRWKLRVRFAVWRTVVSSQFCTDSTYHIFATEVGKQWTQRQHIPSLLSVTVCHSCDGTCTLSNTHTLPVLWWHMHIIQHALSPSIVVAHAHYPTRTLSQYCDGTCTLSNTHTLPVLWWHMQVISMCSVTIMWWHTHVVCHTWCTSILMTHAGDQHVQCNITDRTCMWYSRPTVTFSGTVTIIHHIQIWMLPYRTGRITTHWPT